MNSRHLRLFCRLHVRPRKRETFIRYEVTDFLLRSDVICDVIIPVYDDIVMRVGELDETVDVGDVVEDVDALAVRGAAGSDVT